MPLHVCENERINTAINAAATPTATSTSTSTKPAFAGLAVGLRRHHIDKPREPVNPNAPNQSLRRDAQNRAARTSVRCEHDRELPFRQAAGVTRDEIECYISGKRNRTT